MQPHVSSQHALNTVPQPSCHLLPDEQRILLRVIELDNIRQLLRLARKVDWVGGLYLIPDPVIRNVSIGSMYHLVRNLEFPDIPLLVLEGVHLRLTPKDKRLAIGIRKGLDDGSLVHLVTHLHNVIGRDTHNL